MYGKLRVDVVAILRKLCEMKDVEILEAHALNIFITWLRFHQI